MHLKYGDYLHIANYMWKYIYTLGVLRLWSMDILLRVEVGAYLSGGLSRFDLFFNEAFLTKNLGHFNQKWGVFDWQPFWIQPTPISPPYLVKFFFKPCCARIGLNLRGAKVVTRPTVMTACVKPLAHQSSVLTAFQQRSKKLQNAEVLACSLTCCAIA